MTIAGNQAQQGTEVVGPFVAKLSLARLHPQAVADGQEHSRLDADRAGHQIRRDGEERAALEGLN